MVAETVIRIIQTYSKRDRNSSFRVNDTASESSVSTTGDAILVFLSGIQSIDKVNRALRQRNMVALNAQVHMLHGSLPPERQRRVFKKTKPGEWKIVLSTNIAETSVTVEDVTHVVDCGMVKELRFDAVANMSSLQEVVVSRASARQRAGRAGRFNLHNLNHFTCFKPSKNTNETFTSDLYKGIILKMTTYLKHLRNMNLIVL
jgi:HrpA-like RNA helicase